MPSQHVLVSSSEVLSLWTKRERERDGEQVGHHRIRCQPRSLNRRDAKEKFTKQLSFGSGRVMSGAGIFWASVLLCLP